MGKPTSYLFGAAGRKLTSIELSAEILKALRRAATAETREEVDAAVVTVPANFDLAAVNATVDAARLAGISDCRTEPEPVAAAVAYVRKGLVGDGYWLVYDIGGGTFDAALLETAGGRPHLLEHAGEEGLGGKLIDWDIVTKLLVPQLLGQKFGLPDFTRENLKWRTAFGKLKLLAEKVKIALSTSEHPYTGNSEKLCEDATGRSVEFDFEVKREDVARLARPYIARSIKVCRDLLASKRLKPESLVRLVLVGGPTLAPYVVDQLEAELKAPIDRSNDIDPLTVVSRGAAAMAAAIERSRIDQGRRPIPPPRKVFLDYGPATGTGRRPTIKISLTANNDALLRGATLRLVSESLPAWDSGAIGVPDTNEVSLRLLAPLATNVYRATLRDAQDGEVPVEPATISYNKRDIQESFLINSVGIRIEGGRFERFFTKGQALPAELERRFVTTGDLRAGDAAALPLDVVFYEGENERAIRNKEIGRLRIEPSELRLNLPQGSEVRVRIDIDAYRRVATYAYCPLLEEEWEGVWDPKRTAIDPAALQASAREAHDRRAAIDRTLAGLRNDAAAATMTERAETALREIDQRDLETALAQEFGAASADHDSADRAERHLRELHGLLDAAEDALAWPCLVMDVNEWADYAQRLISNNGLGQRQYELDALRARLDRHIQEGSRDLLLDVKHQLQELCWDIKSADTGIMKADLDYVAGRQHEMTNSTAAQQYLRDARAAEAAKDHQRLADLVGKLYGLLPRQSTEDLAKAETGGGEYGDQRQLLCGGRSGVGLRGGDRSRKRRPRPPAGTHAGRLVEGGKPEGAEDRPLPCRRRQCTPG